MERPSSPRVVNNEVAAGHGARKAREGVRRQPPMTALINYGLHYSQRWPIRDLSPTGAYVEMPGRSLKAGAMVEFVLRLQRHEQSLDLRLPARVVRVDEAGAALSFGGYDDPTYTELVKLLYSD